MTICTTSPHGHAHRRTVAYQPGSRYPLGDTADAARRTLARGASAPSFAGAPNLDPRGWRT